VVTDGSTLLGADDKAGVSEIMTMAERLLTDSSLKHGDIKIAFSPDEEGADGIRMFNVKAFDADYAYTVDGGKLGEIEYENFNAAGFKVIVHGREVHPGEAKNKMVNAALLVSEFIGMLPASETPATTEGYEGFYHLAGMGGDCSEAFAEYILRDHDKTIFEKRKAFIKETVAYLNAKYGEGTFTLEMKDSYYNMREKVEPHMYIVENAKKAMEEAGVTPIVVPIRGGTDGAKLSFEGLPCPNLSTGGFNFHGRYEYIPVESMEKMVEVLLNLAVVK
ncbi:MAG: peptidase T, partial [Firmicutes bacterium]|nr:peptidase T [Bacillota bacterium]